MTTPPPKKHSFNLNFETIGSLTAMLIGACALFVAWDQAQVMRKQQHASVWPLIDDDFTINPGENDTLTLGLTLQNRGVGPAIVERAFLTIDGERINRREDFMRALFGENRPTGSARITGSSVEGGVLGAGEDTEVFNIAWEQTEANTDAFRALALRYLSGSGPDVSLATCYCSVFDRCFEAGGTQRPKPVKTCPEPMNFFSNFLSDESHGETQ